MIGPVPLHSFFMNRQLPRFIHMQEGIDFLLRDAFLHSLQLAMPRSIHYILVYSGSMATPHNDINYELSVH